MGCDSRLFLSYRPPYDWQAILRFFDARAIAGLEVVEHGEYWRTIDLGGMRGTIRVRPAHGRDALEVRIRLPGDRSFPSIAARVSRMFDLAADVAAVSAHLSTDPLLGSLVGSRPGLRLPGAWDSFELAVRAILGQQITVSAARLLGARIVEAHGSPLERVATEPAGLAWTFPKPARLASADLATMGMPRARAAALSGLATAVAADSRLLRPGRGLEASVARLRSLPGIGEWTAQYIVMRAFHEPDAFPASDVGLLRAMTGSDGIRPDPAALRRRAEPWRPWRAYAAQHLWSSLDDRRHPTSILTGGTVA